MQSTLHFQYNSWLKPEALRGDNLNLKIMFNRNIFENSFSGSTIDAVWQKGKTVPGYDANIYRKDTCGAWMKKSEYGNIASSYGWEIDHIMPKSKGGTDDLSNLQPLQWENNRHKGDNYPNWTCKIRA